MEWGFSISDAMSSPLRKMQSELAQTTSSLKSTEAEIAKFERAAKLDAISKEGDPIKKQHASLQLYRDDLKAQQGALEKQTEAHKSAGGGVAAFAGEIAIAIGAIAGVADVAGAAVGKVLSLGMSFVKAGLEAASFKRDTMMALEAITGTPSAAAEAYTAIGKLAENSKYTRAEIAGVYTELARFKQLNKNNVDSITAASLSVGAKEGEPAKAKLLAAIQGALGEGHFDMRSMNELKGVATASPEQLIAVLAKQHNTNEAGVKKLLEAGKISAGEGINAILDLVRKNVDKGGDLGSLSKAKAGGDVGSQVKNISENIHKLFEGSMKEGPVVDALKKVRELLDPTSKSGQKVQAVMSRMFTAIGNAIGSIDWDKVSAGFDSLVSGANRAWTFVEKLVAGFKTGFGPALGIAADMLSKIFGTDTGNGDLMASVFEKIGTVLGFMTGVLVESVAGIVSFFGILGKLGAGCFAAVSAGFTAVKSFLTGLVSDMLGIGKSIVDGLWDGIKSAWAGMLAKFKELVGLLPPAVKSVLGIASPSKVMFGLGQHTTEGFAQGIEAGPRPELDSMMPTVSLGIGHDGGGSYRGAADTPTLHLEVHTSVHVDGGAAANSEGLAKMIAEASEKAVVDRTRIEFMRFAEGLGIEAGAL